MAKVEYDYVKASVTYDDLQDMIRKAKKAKKKNNDDSKFESLAFAVESCLAGIMVPGLGTFLGGVGIVAAIVDYFSNDVPEIIQNFIDDLEVIEDYMQNNNKKEIPIKVCYKGFQRNDGKYDWVPYSAYKSGGR